MVCAKLYDIKMEFEIMKKLTLRLSFFGLLMMLVLGGASIAEAQGRNQREVRDLIRKLNNKVDEFEQTLVYRLRSTSSSQNVVNNARR